MGSSAAKPVPIDAPRHRANAVQAPARTDNRKPARRPWQVGAAALEGLSHVGSYSGALHQSELLWIPGVVLGIVTSPETATHVLQDLQEAISGLGDSHGVLMLLPDVPRTAVPSETELARLNIQLETPTAEWLVQQMHQNRETPLDVQRQGQRYLQQIGRQTAERLHKQMQFSPHKD